MRRRTFLKAAGLGGATLLGCGGGSSEPDGGRARDGATALTDGAPADAALADGGPPLERGPIRLSSWRNSRLSLRWIYPSEDESQPHWRHRRAPSGLPWSIPLGVLGGGYPYNFEILGGPPGLTVESVGFDVGRPPYYYSLSLPDPQIGTSTISIRVTDQNGMHATRSWSFEVLDADDTEAFLFFDGATGDNENPGTRAAPKRDFGGWYLGDEDDPTYRLHQCFYQGDFDVAGAAGVEIEGARVTINESKPRTHVGYGTGARWSGNGAYANFESGAGLYVADLTVSDPAVMEGEQRRNQHFMTANSALASGAIFRVTFLGAETPSDDRSNSSCIMLPEPGRTSSGYCLVGCIAEGVYSQVLLKNYNGLDGVFEGWTVRNCRDVAVVHHKGGDIRRWATRGVLAVEGNSSTFAFEVDEWINDPIAREDLEICWCSIAGFAAGRFINGGGDDHWARIDSYRNHWQVPNHRLSASTGIFTFEGDVLQHSGAHPAGLEISDEAPADVNPVDNVVETTGLLDAENRRIGGPDADHGCEMVFADE
jgi:hypothetical protein